MDVLGAGASMGCGGSAPAPLTSAAAPVATTTLPAAPVASAMPAAGTIPATPLAAPFTIVAPPTATANAPAVPVATGGGASPTALPGTAASCTPLQGSTTGGGPVIAGAQGTKRSGASTKSKRGGQAKSGAKQSSVQGGGPAGRRPVSSAREGTLMIGDSITVGMEPYVPKRANGGRVKVDATGGIPLEEGMRRYRAVKDKPRVVDMGLFTNNFPSEKGELRKAIKETIADARERGGKVVWATIAFPDRDYTEVNAMIRQMAKQNSDVMGLVDWKQMTDQHPNYLISDKIHPSESGAKARIAAYAQAAKP